VAVAEGAGSVALGGDAIGSVIVTGSGNTVQLDLGSLDGDLLRLLSKGDTGPSKRARPRPVRLAPPPFPDHLDREQEVAEVLARSGPGAPVNVYGEDGIGKTYVLTAAANEAPDGDVVLLDGGGASRQDLLQQLFEALYECHPPTVQSETQHRVDLRDREVLVIIDSFELERSDAQRLFAAAPGCRFVVASGERRVWEGAGLQLGGLPPADAVHLLLRELGLLSFTDEEVRPAEAVCQALGHNPLSIRQAASVARDREVPLRELAAWLAGESSDRLAVAERAFGAAEREVLSALAPFGGAPVGTEHVGALTGNTEAETTLRHLEGLGVVASHSPRYSIVGLDAADVGRLPKTDVEAMADRAIGYFAGWAREHRGDPRALLEQWQAVLAMLHAAAARGRIAEVVELGHALSVGLSWGRRWGRWREVLETVLAVSRRAGERQSEAWALHQLGTRAVALGERAEGTRLLREALALRESIGSDGEAAVTRHNLDVARQLGRQGWGPGRLFTFGLLATAVVVAGGAVLVLAQPASVALDVEASGRGTVRSDPAGIDCGGSCTASFREGRRITLTASASAGAAFVRWDGGGCEGTGPCSVTLERDTSVTAVFDAVPLTRALTVSKVGAGTVTSVPSGIDCGRSCSASFRDGTRVTLTAAAARNGVFAGWTGGGCTGTGPCTVTLRRDTTVEARFEEQAQTQVLTVETSGDGGSVTSEPSGIDCGRSCQASFARGTSVVLTASVPPNAVFVGWRGASCKGTGTCTVTMDEDRSVTAVFRQSTRTLTVRRQNIDGREVKDGTVTSAPGGIACGATCSATVPRGTVLTLTAEPTQDQSFQGWSGGGCQGKSTCRVTLDENTTVVATFAFVVG
jgi:hypothetical protein